MLDKFSEAIRGNMTRNQRSKIVALVTIEVHARDIIDKLYKTGCNDINAFDWLSQLRLYWEKVRPFFSSLILLSAPPETSGDVMICVALQRVGQAGSSTHVLVQAH